MWKETFLKLFNVITNLMKVLTSLSLVSTFITLSISQFQNKARILFTNDKLKKNVL